MQRFLTTRDFIWHDDLFLPRMGPVIGLFLSRGPSSFFRRVGAVPSTIIISQNDAATTKDLWKRSLSLSLSLSRHRPGGNSATLSRTKRLRVASSPHRPRSLRRLALFFFFFSAENPTDRNPTSNQSTLSRFIARLIFRDGFISDLKIFAMRVRHCSTIAGNGRGDLFFFLIWRTSNRSPSTLLPARSCWFIEAWLIHRKNLSRRIKKIFSTRVV